MDVGPPELLIVLIIALVLFGGKKLPELAKGLGSAKKEYERGLKGEQADEAKAPVVATEIVATAAIPAEVVDTTGTVAEPTAAEPEVVAVTTTVEHTTDA